jgi:hypothetical protein
MTWATDARANWEITDHLLSKIKIEEVVLVMLESNPVSYSWFSVQVGPLHILPQNGLMLCLSARHDVIKLGSGAWK